MLLTLPKPTIVAVTPATTPVNVGLFDGALLPINVVTVVEKFESLPKAAASFFKVFHAVGAAFTEFDTAVST